MLYSAGPGVQSGIKQAWALHRLNLALGLVLINPIITHSYRAAAVIRALMVLCQGAGSCWGHGWGEEMVGWKPTCALGPKAQAELARPEEWQLICVACKAPGYLTLAALSDPVSCVLRVLLSQSH